MSLLTGMITVCIEFFLLEFVLQRQLAVYFFPDGNLSDVPGTMSISIRKRLMAMIGACNIVSFFAVMRWWEIRSILPPGCRNSARTMTPISLPAVKHTPGLAMHMISNAWGLQMCEAGHKMSKSTLCDNYYGSVKVRPHNHTHFYLTIAISQDYKFIIMTQKQIFFPEKLKKRLYPVVLELFSKNDFHKVNIREISTRSGISTATIYKYFPSKENLLFTLLDEKLKELEQKIMQQIIGLQSTRSIFKQILLSTMDYYDQNPGVAITAFITVPTRTWMQQSSFSRNYEYIFAEVLEQGKKKNEVDPAMNARRFRDFYYMICYRVIYSWYYYNMKLKLVDAVNRDFKLWWKMIANPQKPVSRQKALDP